MTNQTTRLRSSFALRLTRTFAALVIVALPQAAWSIGMGLSATPNPNTGDYTVSWVSQGGGIYKLQERLSGTSTWTTIYTTGITSTSYDIVNQPDGDYEHRIWHRYQECTGGGRGGCTWYNDYSETLLVSVVDTIPPPPPPAPPTSDPVDPLAASFSVDDKGLANYTIPISVTPGMNGLTPELALTYNHSLSEGIAGVGWGLSGVSAIARCRKTLAQDFENRDVELTLSDRFCIGGVQLRLTSGSYGAHGSTYRTEVDTISKFSSWGVAGNGPMWFRVEHKNGLVYEYGQTNDSRIESLATGFTTTALTWLLNKIEDRSGNQIVFEYVEDGAPLGSYRIDKISYLLNPSQGDSTADYTIEFVYQNHLLDDIDSRYVAGGIIEDTKQLDRIDVNYVVGGTQLIRRYELTYESALSSAHRGRLEKVEECAGQPLQCAPATTFTYQNGTQGVQSEALSGSNIPSGANVLPLDINGDGRTDIVYPSSVGAGNWYFRLANTTGGYGLEQDSGIANTGHDHAIGIDFNADGLDDILVPYDSTNWYAIQGTTTGLQAPIATNVPLTSSAGNAIAMDKNGDGLDDLVYGENIGVVGVEDKVWVRYRDWNGPNEFDATPSLIYAAAAATIVGPRMFEDGVRQTRNRQFDVNGDGNRDLAVHTEASGAFWTFVFLGQGGGSSFSFSSYGSNPLPIDANGDGYTDIAYRDNNLNLKLRLSNGKDFGPEISAQYLASYSYAKAVAMDWDSDGFQDLVMPQSQTNKLYVFRSRGSTFETPQSTSHSSNLIDTAHPADINGDGLDDIAYTKTNGDYAYLLHSGIKPDLLTSATDGNGNAVSFAYAPLTSDVYEKYSDAVNYSKHDYVAPSYVVESMTATTGVDNDTYTLSYSYAGAVFDVFRRTLSSFDEKVTTDSRNGMTVTENFNRDFPFRGRKYKTQLVASDSTLVQETTYQWDSINDGIGYQGYSFPYLKESVEKNYKLGTAPASEQINEITRTAVDVDNFGTIKEQKVVTKELATGGGVMPGAIYTQIVKRLSIANDTVSWCIGKPGQMQFTNSHDQASGASITRNVDLNWSTNSLCRLTQEIVEPGNVDKQVTRDIGYDSFGNINSEMITGYGMTARTTQTTWGAGPTQFPTTNTNPLGHSSTTTWDYAVGLPLSQSDPNSLQVSWLYDAFGRKTQEIRPDGTYTNYVYEACSSANSYCGTSYSRVSSKVSAATKSVDHIGINTSVALFDKASRQIQTQQQMLTGQVSRQRTTYDEFGRVFEQSAPDFAAAPAYYSTTMYDDLNRPIDISRQIDENSPGQSQTTSIVYDGLTTTTTDAEGKSSIKISDAMGRVRRSIDHDGYYQQFDYDAFGSLSKVTDSAFNELQSFTYAYGISAHRTQSTDIDMGAWTYDPNPLGEMTAYTDANGNSFSATFDLLGRPDTRSDPIGAGSDKQITRWVWGVSAAAHDIGRLASVSTEYLISSQTTAGPSESYSYDDFGRLVQRTSNLDAAYETEYEYHPYTGQLESLTYPTSTSQYRLRLKYDYQFGILNKVSDYNVPTTVFWEANTVNARGNVTNETLGAKNAQSEYLQTARVYDAITGNLNVIQSGVGNNTDLQDMEYQWNKVGSLKQRHDDYRSLTEVFNYDNLHRLESSTIGGSPNLDIDYDLMGNITRKDDVGIGTWSYHPNKKHAVTVAGSNTYIYDDNGNQIKRNANDIEWTSYNYPSLIEDGSKTYQYFYDANRQRWKQTYDNGTQLEETIFIAGIMEKRVEGINEEFRHYISAGNRKVALVIRDAAGEVTRYILQDHMGSTAAIVNDQGGYFVDESFAAYGERRDPNDWDGAPSAPDQQAIADTTQRGFTFHTNLEDSSYIHMNGRVADGTTGRFISADPYIFNPGSTQSFNRYSYVRNNPLSFTDPSGFCINGFDTPFCAQVITSVFASVGKFLFGKKKPPFVRCKGGALACFGKAVTSQVSDIVDDILNPYGFDRSQAGLWGECRNCLNFLPVASASAGSVRGTVLQSVIGDQATTEEALKVIFADAYRKQLIDRLISEAERVVREFRGGKLEDNELIYGSNVGVTRVDVARMDSFAILGSIGMTMSNSGEAAMTVILDRLLPGVGSAIEAIGEMVEPEFDMSGWIGQCIGKQSEYSGHCGFFDPEGNFHDINIFLPAIIRPSHLPRQPSP